MKKTIYFIGIVILFICSCSSNKSPLTNQLIDEKPKLCALNFQEGIVEIPQFLYKGNFYFLHKLDSNEFVIGIANNDTIEYLSLDLQDEKNLVFDDVKTLFVSDQYIIFLLRIHTENDLGYVVLYENNKNSNFKFVKSEELKSSKWEQVFHFDNVLYFARHYNYHPDDHKIKSFIEAIDINSMEEKYSKEIAIKGIQFTHFKPTNPVAYNTKTKRIIYCDYTGFNIKLLNEELIEIDNYKNRPENWSSKYESMLEKIEDSCASINAYPRIKYLKELQKDGMSRMIQIGFINDSTIFASYYSGNKKDFNDRITYYDILRINNNKILPLYQGIRDDRAKNYYPLMFMDNHIHFYNNTAYFLSMGSYKSFLNMNTPDWLKYTLSGIAGTNIYLNLVELKFDEF